MQRRTLLYDLQNSSIYAWIPKDVHFKVLASWTEISDLTKECKDSNAVEFIFWMSCTMITLQFCWYRRQFVHALDLHTSSFKIQTIFDCTSSRIELGLHVPERLFLPILAAGCCLFARLSSPSFRSHLFVLLCSDYNHTPLSPKSDGNMGTCIHFLSTATKLCIQ